MGFPSHLLEGVAGVVAFVVIVEGVVYSSVVVVVDVFPFDRAC